MPGQITPPKTLCILRLSAIGDVCHTVALVQNIQKHWPETKITWVIGRAEKSLVTNLPGIEFVEFDKKAGLKGYFALRKALKGRNFDVLFHMQLSFRASIASLCIPAKTKIGFDKQRSKEGQHFFVNKTIASQSQAHVVDSFLAFAQALGLPEESPQWEMPLSTQDFSVIDNIIKTKPIVVFCPAASNAERNWLPERYAAVADEISARGFDVVICGAPTEHEHKLANDIIARATSPITDLVGKTNLKGLLATLKRAHFVLAPDTGPAHMAVSVQTPVVGLYAHSNPKRTGPYLYQDYVVDYYQTAITQQQGKPPEHLRWGIRAKGGNLMANISVAQVLNKIDLLLLQHPVETEKLISVNH